MNHKTRIWLWSAGVAALCLISYMIGKSAGSGREEKMHDTHAAVSQAATWTCSMHPQIKLPQKGKCPICFMDLIPLQDNDMNAGMSANQLSLSPAARQLAAIATVPAARRGATAEIRMSGKIAVDESRRQVITSRIMGRIDRLYVNTTGVSVRAGDHLAELYSPDLLTAQRELVSAHQAAAQLPSTASEAIRGSMEKNRAAAQDKLRLLGFDEQSISAIITNANPSDHMTIRSAQKGVVIEKMAVEGAYIETGMPLFVVADLSRVWVMLDAYESDIAWLRLGQKVQFSVEAWPGDMFDGTVSFIDPMVDPMMRTVKVRVTADNASLRLKPDMLVRALVKAGVSASGKVINTALRGKWVSPMHPEIVKDGPGTCDICGMPLVPAEELGYVTSGFENVAPLMIPATAPLLTGERAIVYAETSGDGQFLYEGREVVLGPRVGDYYVVKSGLSEGEMVVVNGAFQIDSELQIRGKKSMMSPVQTVPQPATQSAMPDKSQGPVSAAFVAGLAPVFDAYFAWWKALAADNFAGTKTAMASLNTAVTSVVPPSGSARAAWQTISAKTTAELARRESAASLTDARSLFENVSTQIIALQEHYGHAAGATRYLAFCPMAFNNKGAYWLQNTEKIANPYFGASMLRCGEIKKTFAPPAHSDRGK